MAWLVAGVRRSLSLPDARLADAVTLATRAGVCGLLAIWLVAWLLLLRPPVEVLPVAFPASTDTPAPLAARLGEPARLALLDVARTRLGLKVEETNSLDGLKAQLARPSSVPAILFASAPSGLRQGQGRAAVPASADELADAIAARPGRRKVLLLLDVGQSGPEPSDAGDAAGFLDHLRRRYKKDPDAWAGALVVGACDRDQPNLPIEAAGVTLFAHAVREALPRAGRVQVLLEKVGGRLSDGARALAPEARQALALVGDQSLDFAIPIARSPRGPDAPPDLWTSPDANRIRQKLRENHETRERLESRRAYRDPTGWRAYLEALLDAERHYRAGLFEEAGESLRRAHEAEQRLAPDSADLRDSLVALARFADPPEDRERYKSEKARLERALVTPPGSGPGPPSAPAAVVKVDGASPASPTPAGTPSPAPTKPEPPGPEAAASAKDADPTAARPVDSLIAAGENPWKAYIEGRLIDRAIAYRSLRPAFADELRSSPLGDAFREAVQVEILAAEAALDASPEYPALLQLVEAGDEARRLATDALFLSAPEEVGAIHRNLLRARGHYEAARRYGEAFDLTARVAAELPFLAAWRIRHDADVKSSEAAGPFEKLALAARNLSVALDGHLRGPADQREGPGNPGLDSAIQELRRSYRALQGDFAKTLSAKLSDADKDAEHWISIDDLLGVPIGIASRDREALIVRARDLSKRALPPPDRAATDDSTREQLAEIGEDLVQRDISASTTVNRGLRGKSSSPASGDAAARPAPLPQGVALTGPYEPFARQRRCLVDLEFRMLRLALGTAGGPEVSPQRLATPGDLAEVRQRLRASLASAGSGGPPAAPLILAALPPYLVADSGVRASGTRPGRWLAWEAGRRLEDLDVERGANLLTSAAIPPADRETLARRARTLRNPDVLTVVAAPKDGPASSHSLAMRVTVRASADVPRGRAYLHAATLAAPGKPARLRAESLDPAGPGVPISGAEASCDFRVARSGVENTPVREDFAPVVFYRGLTPRSNRPVPAALGPLKEYCRFTLNSEGKEALQTKGWRCQFKMHADDLYIYEGKTHTFHVIPEFHCQDDPDKPHTLKFRLLAQDRPLLESPPSPCTPGKTRPVGLVTVSAAGAGEVSATWPPGQDLKTAGEFFRAGKADLEQQRLVFEAVLVADAANPGAGGETVIGRKSILVHRNKYAEMYEHSAFPDEYGRLVVRVTRGIDGIGFDQMVRVTANGKPVAYQIGAGAMQEVRDNAAAEVPIRPKSSANFFFLLPPQPPSTIRYKVIFPQTPPLDGQLQLGAPPPAPAPSAPSPNPNP